MDTDESLFLVEYQQWYHIIDEIRRCLRLSKEGGEPTCFALEGFKGSGKTTLIKTFKSDFPPRMETPSGSIIPDLYVPVPVKATPRALAVAILYAMGDPGYYKGQAETMKLRIVKLAKLCQVERLYLDDFHHLVDSDNDKVLQGASDWVKDVIKLIGKPVVVVGLPDKVTRVLRFNPQFGRLFASPMTLEPFSWKTTADKKQFKIFVMKFMEHYDTSIKEELPEAEVFRRVHFATDGNVANIKNLILFAIDIANEQQAQFLTFKTLSVAFEGRFRGIMKNKTNPFEFDDRGNPVRLSKR